MTARSAIVHRLLAALLLLALVACARDVNDPDAEDPFPVEVHMAMRTRGTFDPQTWYYIVFNFTAAPTTTLASNPIDRVSNEDRADKWELYVAYNRDENNVESLVTLQRPNVPTVLPTARGPVDCTTGDFDANEFVDVAVACRTDNIVQILLGTPPNIINPVFFLDASDVEASAGVAPIRLHAAEMTGDTALDLLVIYEGPAGAPFYRLLPGDAVNATFLTGTDQPLPALPVDAAFGDFNGDTEADFAVITTGDAAADNALHVFLGNGAGVFTESETLSIPDNPRTVAAGLLDDAGLDIVVADGGNGSNGSVLPFLSNGDGTFDPQTALAIEGDLHSAAIGEMFGNDGDILIALENAAGEGVVAVIMNEAAAPFQTPAVGVTLGGNPTYVIAHEAGGDGDLDAILVDGDADGGQTLFIQRGDRVPPVNVGDPTTFEWNLETITYLTGVGPSRILLSDLDKNGVLDLVIPNSADANGGNSVSLCYGLGRYNYTNADIFWTDDQPELLVAQEWYITHSIGPNFMELTLDPALFFDLARLPPDRERGFNFTFMTATSAIELERNLNQEGEVRDFLSAAINVPMQVDFYNDQQNLPLANQNIAPLDSQDIENWLIEVF